MDFNGFFNIISPYLSIFISTLFLIAALVPTLQWMGITQFLKKGLNAALIIIVSFILIYILVGLVPWNNLSNRQHDYAIATSGSLIFSDPLSAQDDKQWQESAYPRFTCVFKDGAYHAINLPKNSESVCLAHAAPTLSNFAFEVEMTIIRGDAGGIAFQANGISDFYRFTIHANGFYELYIKLSNPTRTQTLVAGNVSLNKSPRPNLLTVRVYDGHIYLYVNRLYLADAGDDILRFGEIGVFGYNVVNPTDVAFNNAQLLLL